LQQCFQRVGRAGFRQLRPVRECDGKTDGGAIPGHKSEWYFSTACNAIHSIEQRTAKWILAAMERTYREDAVSLTHEQLATLLGVGRSYISRVMQTFKAEGVLETRRGSILVRNREALGKRACQCNEAVKNHFEEVLHGVYPTEEAQSA
jgi:DNA-binding transcriptional regulator YhcF (GntR family)